MHIRRILIDDLEDLELRASSEFIVRVVFWVPFLPTIVDWDNDMTVKAHMFIRSPELCGIECTLILNKISEIGFAAHMAVVFDNNGRSA